MVLNNIKDLPSRHSFTVDVFVFYLASLPKNAAVSKDQKKMIREIGQKRVKKEEKTVLFFFLQAMGIVCENLSKHV